MGTAQNYAALITGVTNTRASNSLSYALPRNSGGVYGEVIAFVGENLSTAANSGDGKGSGFRIGYSGGPVDLALGYGGANYVAGNVRQGNIGASWNFGAVKLMGNISKDRNGTTNARGWLLGAHVPVGVGLIRASVSQYQIDPAGPGAEPRSRKLALGYVHNLSKRTALYSTVARVAST